MTKNKLTVLIALKSLLISIGAMAISLYLSLLYLPRPSIFNPDTNPRPPVLWERLFLGWILILGIVGLVVLLKNKFLKKTSTNEDPNSPIVKPLISAWVIFLMMAIPSGLLTIRVTGNFSPSLRSHTNYHISEAIRFNDEVTLAWLLAIANIKQFSPLVDLAIQNNSEACLNLLALLGAKPNQSALPFILVQGAATGNNSMIQLMLKYGLNVNTQTSYGQTPLIAATEQNKLATIEFLIKAGADINLAPNNSYPPLVIALLNDNNNIVKTLVKAGADVKTGKLQKDFSLASKVASETGEKPMLSLPSDSNALMLAAASANVEGVKILLEAGAPVSNTNSINYNALMYAKASGCIECEQALVAAGAK